MSAQTVEAAAPMLGSVALILSSHKLGRVSAVLEETRKPSGDVMVMLEPVAGGYARASSWVSNLKPATLPGVA